MIEQDTIRLLQECDAGTKMAVSSIDDVQDAVCDRRLGRILQHAKQEHEALDKEIKAHLDRFHDDGKEPNVMAKGMSWIKTNVMMGMEPSDRTIAGLMTDGSDMGVKSLSRYLNQYKAADEQSKDIARRLIALEEGLCKEMRGFL